MSASRHLSQRVCRVLNNRKTQYLLWPEAFPPILESGVPVILIASPVSLSGRCRKKKSRTNYDPARL